MEQTPMTPETTQNEQETSVDTTAMKMPEGVTSMKQEGDGHSYLAPIIGILILILALTLGGLYLWGGVLVNTETPATTENSEEAATTTEQETQTMEQTDSLDAIEASVTNEELGAIETDLSAIESELNAALQE